MAFNPEEGRVEYIASAAQTVFPFAFKIFVDTDIKVYQTPSGQTPDDAVDIILLTTDYTVTINGDLGGVMTLVSGATSGDSITIVRDLAITRPVEYQTNGDLLADTLNDDQDYQTYLTADRDTTAGRHLTLPESAQMVSAILPPVIPLSFMQWDPLGQALINVTSLQADGFLWTAADVYTKDEVYSKPEIDSFNQISGLKNILINGDKRVNQREYSDGILADGIYGYDRWKGADTDANIEQIIEQQNITTGTYTISWVGGGTATVDGNSGLSSGDSILITVASNISVKVPKASTNIQLEPGSIATTFELSTFPKELGLCQRYYEKLTSRITSTRPPVGLNAYATWSYKVTKRVTPSVTLVGTGALTNTGVDHIQVVESGGHAIFDAGTFANSEL